MGFVDRGGGREAKGTSLRRSKKNPGAASTRNKGANKNYITPTTRATPTPPPACAATLKALADATSSAAAESNATAAVMSAMERAASDEAVVHIDTAVALLSRKLEDDQEGIFRRAKEEGKLTAAICWSNEVEKQSVLLETCVAHNKLHRAAAAVAAAAASSAPIFASSPSRQVHFEDEVRRRPVPAVTTAGVILYAILGVHVNSVDRVNMRLHEQWITELEAQVKHGDVVGVLSGLSLSRDHGTHYAQERLLKECWRVAAHTHLPLVLHLYASANDDAALTATVDRTAELLKELLNGSSSSATPSAVVLYDGLHTLRASTEMRRLVHAHPPTSLGASAGESDQSTVQVPFYVLATAEGLGDGAAAFLPNAASASSNEAMSLDQLLIGTGAPWGTPQNLLDPYLCTLPNEPGNYPFVVKAVFNALTADTRAVHNLDTTEKLAAVVGVSTLRVFFHECIEAMATPANTTAASAGGSGAIGGDMEQGEDEEAGENSDEEGEDDDDEAQQQWAASQQPASATAIAGVHDEHTRREMEALLAAAAAERAAVEAARELEEAKQEQARAEEQLEKRSKREKKKNVKSNNRSNFTHFRNKDFAARQSRQEKLELARELVGGEAASDEDREGEQNSDVEEASELHTTAAAAAAARNTKKAVKTRAEAREADHNSDDDEDDNHSGSSNSSDEDGSGPEAGSLAAEVERLLQKAEADADTKSSGGGGKRKKQGKGCDVAGAPRQTPPPAATAAASATSGTSNNTKSKKKSKKGQRRAQSSEEEDDGPAEVVAAMMQTGASRRQRKKQQRQQQRHNGGPDSGSDDE